MDEPKDLDITDCDEEPPLLFEVVPPVRGEEEKRLDQHSHYLDLLFEEIEVSALNIPEIQDEEKKGEKGKRVSPFKKRVAPRTYAKKLSERFDTDFVINRVVVKQTPEEQERWVLETYKEYDISNIIFVGGETSRKSYNGPSVPDGNEMVKEFLDQGKLCYNDGETRPTNMTVGNICIPTRRREDFDEPDRMKIKYRSGAEFFTTQIIAEEETPRMLLRDFADLLNEETESSELPTLFWSFSPISSQKDVDFLRWLGVYIPEPTEEMILGSADPAAASIDYAQSVWEKLCDFNNQLPVSFPMGINISVMGLRNFENGVRLAKDLQMVGVAD